MVYRPQWNIWPSLDDPMQDSIIHIIGLDETDIGLPYADGIDNNADPEDPYLLEYPVGLGVDVNSPLVSDDMVLSAANDPWLRYRVPNSNIILYDVNIEDIGKPYADGIDNDGDSSDLDGDGYPYFQELLSETDPNDPTDFPLDDNSMPPTL